MSTFETRMRLLLRGGLAAESLWTRPVTITNRHWHRVPGKCLTDIWLMGWCIQGDGDQVELWIAARETILIRIKVERGKSLRAGSVWLPPHVEADRQPLKVRANRPCIVRLHIYKRKGVPDEG